MHCYYNQHTTSFEKLEDYVRNAMKVISSKQYASDLLDGCSSCVDLIVKEIPHYLSQKVEHFLK